MSDDDLIRRGDALYAIAGWEIPSTAIAALPARGEHGVDAVLDAAHDYLMEQYGYSPLKHPTDRALILAALSPTDAAHVNETPKSEHDADNVLTDAALIARLREIQGQAGLFASAAADRIEALVKEVNLHKTRADIKMAEVITYRERAEAAEAERDALRAERDEHRRNWERAFNANTVLEERLTAAEAKVEKLRESLQAVLFTAHADDHVGWYKAMEEARAALTTEERK